MIKLHNKWDIQVSYSLEVRKVRITRYGTVFVTLRMSFFYVACNISVMSIQLWKLFLKSWINLLSWMFPVFSWDFIRLKIVQIMPGYNGKCLLLTFLITFSFPTENSASAFNATSCHSSVSPAIVETCGCVKGELLVFADDKILQGDTCKLLSFRTNSCLSHTNTFFCVWWIGETRQLADVIKLDYSNGAQLCQYSWCWHKSKSDFSWHFPFWIYSSFQLDPLQLWLLELNSEAGSCNPDGISGFSSPLMLFSRLCCLGHFCRQTISTKVKRA